MLQDGVPVGERSARMDCPRLLGVQLPFSSRSTGVSASPSRTKGERFTGVVNAAVTTKLLFKQKFVLSPCRAEALCPIFSHP
jgi:hypothetical protein